MCGSLARGSPLVAVTLLTLALTAPKGWCADESEFRLRAPMVPTPSQTCGLHSLYVCAKVAGKSFVNVRELHETAAPLDPRGTKASDLLKWARDYDLPVEALRTDAQTLKRWRLPAVLHVNGNHYIALLGEEDGRLVVFDNNIGLFDCSTQWFENRYRWDGVAIVVGDPPSFWVKTFPWPWLMVGATSGFLLVVFAWRTRGRVVPLVAARSTDPASNVPVA